MRVSRLSLWVGLLAGLLAGVAGNRLVVGAVMFVAVFVIVAEVAGRWQAGAELRRHTTVYEGDDARAIIPDSVRVEIHDGSGDNPPEWQSTGYHRHPVDWRSGAAGS